MLTNRQGFEVAPCAKCGGTGVLGMVRKITCFYCQARGELMTPRGKAAYRRMLDLQTRPADEVQAGEYVWQGWPCQGRPAFRRVQRASVRSNGGASLAVRSTLTDYPPGATVRSVRDEAHRLETVAAALAYQATLGPFYGRAHARAEAAVSFA